MGDLASRIEIRKLAHELGATEEELAFLASNSPTQLRELRTDVSNALFARHEDRVTRLASLSKLLPVPLTAKIAELALGPMLSARVAGALDPRDAARLAGHLSPGFLTTLAVSLDPQRVAPIVSLLPDDLIVDVGRRLLEREEFLVLGRFVSIIDADVALRVVEVASEHALLQTALFADDPSSLDAIVEHLSDDTLAGIIRAASEADAYDAAVAILAALSPESCTRIVAQADAVSPDSRDELVRAIAFNEVWAEVLPAMHAVEQPTLAGLINVPSTLDIELVDHVVAVAREIGVAPVLVQLMLAMDDEHLDVLKESTALRDPATQRWLLDNAGVASRLVEAVLSQLSLN
ncbi:hypothetical protein [Nocardioides sp. Kera G14]|uniref:hypothetical protein n=1 Tax=Nocardioides sp. Kera G14 TaxID=2884264 RepID=UPI001D10CFCC|nr:hypothetical protein [Nocardioides sp. Kera G14]UDY22343.1 hypothetical protein LH076_09640 [Nocardioides sp. Kera G14]